MIARRFDADAFATQIVAAMEARKRSFRQVAAEAGVSAATVHRACKGWPDLSHENFLRLQDWLTENPHSLRAA